MNRFLTTLSRLIMVLLIVSTLMTSGCNSKPQLSQDELTKRRYEIMNDRALTTDQKYALVAKLDQPPPSPLILPVIFIIAISPMFFRMRAQAKKQAEERRAAAERLRKLIEKRSRAAAEPPPPPVVYVDPAVVAQKEVDAIPSDERAASFFTSRPYPSEDLVEVTILVGYTVVTVWATSIEAECVRAGTAPLVRAFTLGDQRLPWYEWRGYDPYEHYWQSAGKDWFWVEAKLRASWVELDVIDPALPGYYDDLKTAELDWEKATARQIGVLFRWKTTRKPLVKLKRVIQMASSRRPRQVSPPKRVLEQMAQAAAVEAARKKTPRKSSLKFDSQPVTPLASAAPARPIQPMTPLESVTQPRKLSKRTKPKSQPATPAVEPTRVVYVTNGAVPANARPVKIDSLRGNAMPKNGKGKLKFNIGPSQVVAIAMPIGVGPVASEPKPPKQRSGKSLRAPGGAKGIQHVEADVTQTYAPPPSIPAFTEAVEKKPRKSRKQESETVQFGASGIDPQEPPKRQRGRRKAEQAANAQAAVVEQMPALEAPSTKPRRQRAKAVEEPVAAPVIQPPAEKPARKPRAPKPSVVKDTVVAPTPPVMPIPTPSRPPAVPLRPALKKKVRIYAYVKNAKIISADVSPKDPKPIVVPLAEAADHAAKAESRN